MDISRPWQIAGWTMLHYLWVGALLGFAALLARRLLRSAAANVRYGVALGCLLLLSVAPGIVAVVVAQQVGPSVAESTAGVQYVWHFDGSGPARRVPFDPNMSPPMAIGGMAFPPSDASVSSASEMWDWPQLSPVFDGAARGLPWLWLCGAPLTFALITSGLLGAERLRRQSRPLEDAPVTEMCRRLALALNVSRRVGVGICDRIAVPILVGILRPMILLPAAALAGWTPQQLEMVLLHELAHVRRHDNLVNLLQRIVEAILFFHPMVWVVSGWIRREREYCCDALVVVRTREPHAYAEILVALTEALSSGKRRASSFASPQTVSSMAERPIVGRVRHILKKEEQPMQVSRRTMCVVLAAVFMLAVIFVGHAAQLSRAAEDASKPTASKEPAGQTLARVLHFPKDRSLGAIRIQDENIKRQIEDFHSHIDGTTWTYLADAKGDVAIPAGQRVQLSVGVDAWRDLSGLARLKPNDLYSVVFAGVASEERQADDRCMPHMKRFTGLRELNLKWTRVSGKGLQSIAGMKTLDCLYLPKGLSDADLKPVMELRSLTRLHLHEHQITTAGFGQLTKKLTKLEEMNLGGARLDNTTLVHLANLRALRYLFLGDPFTDDGLVHLKNIPSLRILCINFTEFTDKGAAHLADLPQIENLWLHWKDQITDRGVAHLAKMASLKKLDIGHAKLTDEGAVPLGQSKTLEYLWLPMGLTDKGLMHLAQCRTLKFLSSGGGDSGPYSDTGLKYLAKLPDLECLLIGGGGITDDGIAHLAKLKNLKRLLLWSPNLTNAAFPRLAVMKSLTDLNVMSRKCSMSGVNHLNALTNLTKLSIQYIEQDGAILDIGDLTNLEELEITLKLREENGRLVVDKPFRDEDMACLTHLTKLKALANIDGIGDVGMAQLAGLSQMERLHVGGPQVTDKGLRYLANMKQLDYLGIQGNFTEKGLQRLEHLKSLRDLRIQSNQSFSKESLDRLKRELPSLFNFKLN